MASARPSKDRLASVDITRGVAILAVLLVNVIAMAGPQAGMMNPHVVGAATPADVGVFLAVRVFVEGKFISIFCMLFGVGIALQTSRIEAHGQSSSGVYLRRQGVLAIFGVLHGVLLWWGDILLPYAVLGIVAFAFRNQKLETLRVLAWLALGLGVGMQGVGLLSVATLPPEALDAARDAAAQITLPEGLPAWMYGVLEQDDVLGMVSAVEIGAFQQGPWPYSLGLRTLLFFSTSLGTLLSVGFWLGGLMLLGICLARDGFFDASSAARRRTWMIRGVTVGLLFEIGGNSLCLAGGFDLFTPFGFIGEAIRQFGKPPLAFAWLAAIVSASHRWPTALRPFIATGRLALTNYVGQSLVMAILMMHWGFGLFGTLGRTYTLGIALALLVAQVALSNLWMTRHDRGPLEWVWRRLTYLR